MTVKVHVVVLSEVPAETLLADPRTACFAPCADSSGMSAEELCTRVAIALRDGATGRELHMAVVAAAVRKRYHQMIKAMEAAKIEPVVIEDLVDIGVDMGRADGIQEGRVEGIQAAREMLLETIVARGLPMVDAERERISAESSLDRIREWHRAALHAESMGAVFRE